VEVIDSRSGTLMLSRMVRGMAAIGFVKSKLCRVDVRVLIVDLCLDKQQVMWWCC